MINKPQYVVDLQKRRSLHKKKGLLLPKNKEKKVKFRVNDEWLTVEECIARGLKVTIKKDEKFVEVSSNEEVLESLNIQGSKVIDKSENKNVITKEDLEKRIQKLKENLEFLYTDSELMDSIATIHKEGQMYAYKSLLRQLSEK